MTTNGKSKRRGGTYVPSIGERHWGGEVVLPSEVSDEITMFDRFAEASARLASRAPFFAFCLLLIIVWAPTFLFLKFEVWQLIINTATTIITFLMVALLQNSSTRNDQATQHKLNAIAEGLAALMQHSHSLTKDAALARDIEELEIAVGLEQHESTTHNKREAQGGTSRTSRRGSGSNSGRKPS